MKPGTGVFTVNNLPVDEYFVTNRDQTQAKAPLVLTESTESYDVHVNVKGGGQNGQAGAVLLGVARAIKEVNPAHFEGLRDAGLLTRDSRQVERKKPGRRGARRGFQFSKR
ncbi:MAG: small subunit ribosomal protein S9 [Planctomycetota bacterium]|jgi:small subunit ribosomal protein S9